MHLTGKSIVIYYKNKSLIMNSIINVFKKHNNNMEKLLGKSFSFGSLKNYKTTLKRMVTFIKENYYENDLSLDKINYDFIQNFSQYILEKTSCNHNGMMKHMQRLKKIINICIKQRYNNHNPFDGFYIYFKRSNRVFLSNDELVTYSSGLDGDNVANDPIGGLVTDTEYYVIGKTTNTFKLSHTNSHMCDAAAISLTGVGEGSDHKFTSQGIPSIGQSFPRADADPYNIE